MTNPANRWMVLGLLFLVGLTAPMQFQAVAALAPFLIADAGLTYTDVGVLSGLFMLPGVALAAPIGPLSAWLGDRQTLVLGIVLMAVSAFVFALTDSYVVMLASRVAGGAGAVAVGVLLPKVVTDWFAGREIATGMSIIAASVGLGIGIAMALLPTIAAPTSWRIAMATIAGLTLLSILPLLALYRDEARDQTRPAAGVLLWRIGGRELVLCALAGVGRGLFSSGYAVFMSFLPPLLIARGMPAVEAGVLTSLTAVASIISVPLCGYLSDRTGKPAWFIVGGSLGAASACILVAYIAPPIVWILLFGTIRGGCTGGLMALPSRVLRPESRNTGFAVVSAAYFICMSAFPALAGWLLDWTGRPAAPMWFAGLLWFLITVLLGAFLLLERRWILSPAAGGN